MREGEYQSHVIDRLVDMFKGCFILKNDALYLQGVPDLLILYRDKWAMLEVKLSAKAKEQPNQRFYVSELDKMSFAAFIYPENEEEVLDALQRSFTPRRATRVSQRV